MNLRKILLAVCTATTLSLSASVVSAQGKLSNAKQIPKACDSPLNAYVWRKKLPETKWISNQEHEIWVMLATSQRGANHYTVTHKPEDEKDGAWRVLRWGGFTTNHPELGELGTKYFVYPKSHGGGGWILGRRGDKDFGFCPSKASATDKRMLMWQCNSGGTYPNFYPVSIEGREYVFFDDENDKTFRLSVDEEKRIVQYESCDDPKKSK